MPPSASTGCPFIRELRASYEQINGGGVVLMLEEELNATNADRYNNNSGEGKRAGAKK